MRPQSKNGWGSFFCLSRGLLRGNPRFPGRAPWAMFFRASGAVPVWRNFTETDNSYPNRVLLLLIAGSPI